MKKYTNVFEVLDDIERLRNELENIKLYLVDCGVDYFSQDARMLYLDQQQMIINKTIMWASAYKSLYFKSNESTLEFLKNVRSNLEYEKTEEEMFEVLRNYLIINSHFIIDNLFKNIKIEIKLKVNNNFGIVCQAFKDKDIITENQKNELNVFTSLRNTFHNNGIHMPNDFSYDVNGIIFEFKKNQEIKCAGFEHIYILLHNNIKIIKEIFKCPKIAAYDYIIDLYAESKK